jgi:hypothetical protein
LTENFSWTANDELVSVRKQNAIAVYLSTTGMVVVRQQGDEPGSDACIHLAAHLVPDLIDRLEDVFCSAVSPG